MQTLPSFPNRAFTAVSAVSCLTLLSISVALPSAHAQQTPPPEPAKEKFERFAVGFRTGISLTDQIRGGDGTVTVDDVDPFTGNITSVAVITTGATAPNARFAWGATAQFNITPKIGVNFELMTRPVEFTTTTTNEVSSPDFLTTNFINSEARKTNARYWDVPVLVRYYPIGPSSENRPYFTGGVTIRNVKSLKATLETFDEDQFRERSGDVTDITPSPENTTATGATAGIGIQLKDDVGIKLEIEGRFTRWQQRTFAAGLANSNQNQVEVMLGITF